MTIFAYHYLAVVDACLLLVPNPEGPGVLTPLYLPYTDFDLILARTQTDNYFFFR